MNILSLPLLEAFVLLAKMTVIIVWMTIMLGFIVRVILGSILSELLDFYEKNSQKRKTDAK
jgi:ABC-type polysaccharide transport system permease subunit